MKAIIYKSKTGNTKKYAEILGKKLNVSVYDAKKANHHLKAGDEVIYLGWLCAGSISGFEKARSKYKVLAVCGIGMPRNDEVQNANLKKRHKLDSIPFFYLQGGFDMNKLKGLSKLSMKMMKNVIISSINKKEQITEDDKEMLSMFEHGASFVKEENLDEIIKYFK